MQKSLIKKLGMTVAAIAMAATGLFTATDAEAVPAFARQTGMTCDSCHFQSYPALNGMGRSFKSGGYIMQGTQPMMESADMSLPNTLNMSVIWKYFMNQNANGDLVMANQDEMAFLVGGRVNNHTGFLFEVTGDAFASTKIQFNVSDNIAIVPFQSDAAGPAYGFELMNTALERAIRPIENRRALNGGHLFASKADNWVGATTGIAFVYHTPEFFVNYSMYAPLDSAASGDDLNFGDMAAFIRASYFFDLAGFDSAVGFATRSGAFSGTDNSCDTCDASPVTYTDEAVGGTFIDFQMQGEVGGAPLGFYFTNASGADSAADSVTGLLVKYTAIPHFEVFFANSTGKVSGADAGRGSVGFEYLTSLNTKIMVSSNSVVNGDSGLQVGFETSM